MEMDGDMFITQYPNMGLIPDLKRFINHLGGKQLRTNNYSTVFLYAGLPYYVMWHNDNKILRFLETKSSSFSFGPAELTNGLFLILVSKW